MHTGKAENITVLYGSAFKHIRKAQHTGPTKHHKWGQMKPQSMETHRMLILTFVTLPAAAAVRGGVIVDWNCRTWIPCVWTIDNSYPLLRSAAYSSRTQHTATAAASFWREYKNVNKIRLCITEASGFCTRLSVSLSVGGSFPFFLLSFFFPGVFSGGFISSHSAAEDG